MSLQDESLAISCELGMRPFLVASLIITPVVELAGRIKGIGREAQESFRAAEKARLEAEKARRRRLTKY